MSVVTGVSRVPFQATHPTAAGISPSHRSPPNTLLYRLCLFLWFWSQGDGCCRRSRLEACPECATEVCAGPRDWPWQAASCCQRLAGSSQRQVLLGLSPRPTAKAASRGQMCRLRFLLFSFLTAAQKHRACWEKSSPLVRHPFILKVLKGDCDFGPTYG